MSITTAAALDQLSYLQLIGGVWFDNNPLASENLYPSNWSPWNWVQFGGTSQNKLPNQAFANAGDIAASGGPLTFLGKVNGKYEIHLDKKPTPGKPAANTALFVKQNEIKIRLHLITPLDVFCAKLLLERSCAIFPADAPQANPTVTPIFHPKLRLYARTSFILVSMTYPEEPQNGEPGYIDSVWIPQDIIKNQNQIGPINTGILATGPDESTSTAADATPPEAPNPLDVGL